ncbi:DUF2505 domain-containing protein [Mycobacterium cookii]|uniref:DUF2505 domain-containing protein n=1 Tax=Mycobacterium cookii TaxID=1775 RepID=A0A7I7KWD3_9MYCO|nr:DUF2505 domain-containing protein [Mycobacterium cookii]MCV7331455.1 DUF2505 domain-containing protein [Mycobacterium cookii]BBX45808.1 hypothetical protein MCOO_18230 [Mycobacterium cookii]
MPRSFDVAVDSPVSVDEVLTAFSSEDYWLSRIATQSGRSTLESVVVDDGRTVRVTTEQDLGPDLLPGIVAKFYRHDIKIRHTETWTPSGDQLRGEISVAVSGAPGSGLATASVAPTDDGSVLTVNGTVEFKVPLVGGTVESFIAREFAKGVPDLQAFTARWVTENA